MSYYDYDKNDVAKSIKQAMDNYESPEVVKYLLDERNKKIGLDLQYKKYENDVISKSAQEYINKYSGALGEDIDALYQARADIVAQNLSDASEKNWQTYQSGLLANNQAYDDARKGVYSAYRRSALGNEEVLAASGLGRGISNAASSGFGETSRMSQSMAYQNNVYDLYKDQNNAQNALAGKYMEAESDALKEYNDAILEFASEKIEQSQKDREYRHKLDNERSVLAEKMAEREAKAREQKAKQKADEYANAVELFKTTGVVQNEQQAQILGVEVGTTTAQYQNILFGHEFNMRMLRSEEEQNAFENALAEKKFINEKERDLFDRAYELFESTGSVVTEQMAQVLGIPVGTQYWEYVIDAKNAATSASKAATSAFNASTNAKMKYLNYEVDKQNADTNRYKAETDRMKLTGDY